MNINTSKYYCLAPKTAFLPDNKPSALSSGKKHDCRSAYPQNTANSFYRPLFTGFRPAVRTTVAEMAQPPFAGFRPAVRTTVAKTAQPPFAGSRPMPAVRTTGAERAKALELAQYGDEIFEKYTKNCFRKKFDDFYVYFDREKPKYRDMIKPVAFLLEEPASLPEGIKIFSKYFEKHASKTVYADNYQGIYLYPANVKDLIDKNPYLKNIKIKGMMGNGASCTAFLTDRNTVLKLSFKPLYPAEKDYIEDVDLPIINRFCVPLNKFFQLYGTEEPLTENSEIKAISAGEFEEIYDDFEAKIKKANDLYDFEKDFNKAKMTTARQIGFINGKAYLLDRECVSERPLYKHKKFT